MTGLAVVEGLAKVHLSLQLSLLLLNAELVAGVLDGGWVLETGAGLLSIRNRDEVEGLLGHSLDLGEARDSELNLLLDVGVKDDHVVSIVTTDKVADFNSALVEWALVVEPVGRLDSGELVEGGIVGELNLLDDLNEGLAVTVLLLVLLGSAVGDVKGTERVPVALLLRGAGGGR